ncbi:hypothetical protein [Streptomyces sp. NPDC052192]|uniref:hypothetical protein n=1 Tax=Streptomyces sp. NPDC052192 TaxID=3155052 RepID=UPI003449431B
MVDFNGTTVEALVPGECTHVFVLPHDRTTVPEKTLTALAAAEKAVQVAAEVRTKKAQDFTAQLDAGDKVRAAVADVYDRASSTQQTDRRQHEEAYAYASAKFGRALAEAEAALQQLADHAQQVDNPANIGFKAHDRSSSPVVGRLRLIADTLRSMPSVPELEA